VPHDAPISDIESRKRTTFHYNVIRAPFYGVLEAGWTTFVLIIAIRHFDAPDAYKAGIAGAGPMGFLLTPLTLYACAQLKARPSIASGILFGISALLIIGAALSHTLLIFTAMIIMSQMVAVQQGTLMLQVYAENYLPQERGKMMATPFILTALSSIAFSYVGGTLLDQDIASYRLLFIIMTIAAFGAAWASIKIPSSRLSTEHIGNPWQSLSLIWQDRLFGYLLGTWMLLGLGNLITIPIRVEYLANSEFGVDANNTTIATLLLVVPAIARILSTKLWGYVFDRLHFITTRNLLNTCFLLSIVLFFFSTNLVVLTIAMTFNGFALGGGKIIWNLWVTKIAPHEKISSYMSIHMALTGVRGTFAPFIGYWILSHSAPSIVAIVGSVLIILSIILFECVRGHPRL